MDFTQPQTRAVLRCCINDAEVSWLQLLFIFRVFDAQ